MNPTATILLSLLLLGLASYKAIYNIEGTTDIGFYDESGYLESGFQLLEHPIIDGFLYRAQYFLLHRIGLKATEAYFVQLAILIFLVGLGVFLASLRTGYSPYLAVVFAALIMLTGGLQNAWPHITRLSISIICLIFAIPGKRALAWKNSNIWLLLGAIILCYVRPEFVLTVAMLGAMQLVYEPLRARTWVAFLLIAGLYIFLSPLAEGRGMMAFHQHYLYAKSVDGSFAGNPWTDSTGAFSAVFGNANSLLEALTANPAAFFEHLHGNVRRLPASLANVFRISGASILPLVGGLLLTFYRLRIRSIGKYRFFAVGAFVFPSLLFSLLLYPRDHYLIQALVPALFLLPLEERSGGKPMKGTAFQFLGVFLLLYSLPWRAVPGAAKTGLYPPPERSIHQSGCSNLATLQRLGAMLHSEDYLLAPNETYHVYLQARVWTGSLSSAGFQPGQNSLPSRPDYLFMTGEEVRDSREKIVLLKTLGYGLERIDDCGSLLFAQKR